MKRSTFATLLLFVTAGVAAQDVALKPGEKGDLFAVYWVANCKSILKRFAGADVLAGPPGVVAVLREEPVSARRQGCTEKVSGATLVLGAEADAPAYEGTVRVRVRYVTEDGDKQSVHPVKVLILPK